MSGQTSIEWTDRTWNPLTGCTKVSPGCDHCYAKTMHERFNGAGSFDTVTLHPDRLAQPLRWRKPSMVFVNSMSDLFHQDVPDEYIARVFAAMARGQHHTFQVLTKRHARMRSLLSTEMFWRRMYDELVRIDYSWICEHRLTRPLPNVWLGVSVENQQWADIRIPALLDTPAAVRFLSCEPLLGPIDLRQATRTRGESQRLDNGQIGWVIVGGESGHGARPMQPAWAQSLRDQCTNFDIPFLFKQWGEYAQIGYGGRLKRIGKKAAGRELDGRTWDEYPAVAS
jgi:protein gp37